MIGKSVFKRISFIACGILVLCPVSPESRATDTGTLKWTFSATDAIDASPAIISDGTVYIGGQSGRVHAVKDGQKVWDFDTGDYCYDPSLTPDGHLLIANHEGKVFSLDANTGKEEWCFPRGCTSMQILTRPVMNGGGTVYAGGHEEKLYAIKNGFKLWEFPAGGKIYSTPCLGPDGTLYFGSGNGKLYALRDPDWADIVEEATSKLQARGDQDASAPSDDLDVGSEWIIIDDVKIPVNRQGDTPGQSR